ncbi:DUF3006 domain-containing protein [Sutcliffiella rhizosphaerae]|uniref:DUF3006 domain-containing protein n=1 Tax=Sutcliffiella rhizosphaerae TaxID=2880967 RepID=A0ABM8YR62_9BACI|nr:DUF3006 domain-containing protein [Sutcliffiella rhizosphaerae]CAG9622483.1 hypothetical protein BACCIP111883_03274 [Sutcliffiella rhizosphaerae]
MKKCIVDRLEGSWAVLEYERQTFDCPLSVLPKGVKEGDVLSITFEINESETAKRKRNIDSLAKQLFVEE